MKMNYIELYRWAFNMVECPFQDKLQFEGKNNFWVNFPVEFSSEFWMKFPGEFSRGLLGEISE